MTKPVFIYCLKCPVTGDVRYIGQTNGLKRRLKEHLKRSLKAKGYLGNWLRSLSAPPVLAVLHTVAENESWEEEERRYIACARAIGIDLVNMTDGGEGNSGPRSPETRAAISAALTGVLKSPEHRAANSAAHKGVPHSPERRASQSARQKGQRGHPQSTETRAVISAALTGKLQSRETRARRSAALTGRPRGPRSPEHCAALSAAKKGKPWSEARRAAHEASKLS